MIARLQEAVTLHIEYKDGDVEQGTPFPPAKLRTEREGDMKNAISTILTDGADESPGLLTFFLHQLYQFQYKIVLPPLHVGGKN